MKADLYLPDLIISTNIMLKILDLNNIKLNVSKMKIT